MGKEDLPVSDNELDVLRVLWDDGALALGEVHARLAKKYEYTTVQTMLDRLVQKGLVARDSRVRPARHRATVSRARAMRHYLRLMLDKIADGPAPLVLELLRERQFSAEDLAEIRRRVEESAREHTNQQPESEDDPDQSSPNRTR
jgi:BlaI family transcriptional regulator, penicillinase repressor